MQFEGIDGPWILLIGPPNVGKSALFNGLTGMNVSVANYPGTTVEYAKGETFLGERKVTIIDPPGTYTLEPTNEAERITLEILSRGPSAILNVSDAVNLESSLYLLLQTREFSPPVVVALNRVDVAKEQGKEVDVSLLSQKLDLPVIPTVAVAERGLEELKRALRSCLRDE